MEPTDFSVFLNSDNPVVALLAIMVMALAGVVVYQWHYTTGKTVPKWIWDAVAPRLDTLAETQKNILTIIDERIKK